MGFVPDDMKPGAEVCVIGQNPGGDEEAGRRYLGHEQYEPSPHMPLIGKTGRVWERGYLPLAGLDRSEVSTGNILRCRWGHKDQLPPITQKVVQQAIKHCNRAHFRPPHRTVVEVTDMCQTCGHGRNQHHRDSVAGSLVGGGGLVWMGESDEKSGQTPSDHGQHVGSRCSPTSWEHTGSPLALSKAGVFGASPKEANVGGSVIRSPSNRLDDDALPVHGAASQSADQASSASMASDPPSESGQFVPNLGACRICQTCQGFSPRIIITTVGPKAYIALGEYAFYGLTSLQHDFNGWRGYVHPFRPLWAETVPPLPTRVWTPGQVPGDQPPVYVVHHIARIFREPEAELPAKRDWNKLAQLLAGKWPEPMPPIEADPPEPWPSYAAFDTEFEPNHPERLVRWSLATKDRRVWVVEAARGWPHVLPGSTVIMHNAAADLPHLRGFDPQTVIIEDSMMSHAVLWTGRVETDDQKGKQGGASSHTLNFLGSIYARINRWKHLARIAPRQYAGADALGTMDAWATGLHGGLLGELDRDPQTKWVYENLQKPLIPIIMKAHQRGIATDREAARAALADIKREQDRFELRAQAYAGWALNLRSPQHVAFWLYTIEQIKARRAR